MNSPGVNRTIEDLAEAAGASARTLIRLFPKETGLKYRQWVQQVQIADAICRLGRGESIARISDALGYASPSAFSAMFKRIFGVAPNQYLQAPNLNPLPHEDIKAPHPNPLPEGEGAKSGNSELAPEPPLPLGEDLGEGAVLIPIPQRL